MKIQCLHFDFSTVVKLQSVTTKWGNMQSNKRLTKLPLVFLSFNKNWQSLQEWCTHSCFFTPVVTVCRPPTALCAAVSHCCLLFYTWCVCTSTQTDSLFRLAATCSTCWAKCKQHHGIDCQSKTEWAWTVNCWKFKEEPARRLKSWETWRYWPQVENYFSKGHQSNYVAVDISITPT